MCTKYAFVKNLTNKRNKDVTKKTTLCSLKKHASTSFNGYCNKSNKLFI
nr:MAG TPA: hypothetical protein [Caudoviricetes sp.]